MTHPITSLAHGNRFQRAYYRWALPHYERMAPDLREQVEAMDLHLYTRQGLGTWVSLLGIWGGIALGLHAAGIGWAAVLVVATLLALVLLFLILGIWIQPEKMLSSFFSPRKGGWLLAGLGVGLCGGLLVHWVRRGAPDLAEYFARRGASIVDFMSGMALGMAAALLLIWSVAKVRSGVIKRQRDRARLEAERDAAQSQAHQAQLRVLQAQIHPHFLFNTLAALQHWVDKGDPRAGALLREVTAFLRGATELLGQETVALGEEWGQVGHYLAIMKARWGERLRYELALAPGLEGQRLPPGLLLTLVENAVEHGIAHQLDGGAIRVEAAVQPSGWTVRVEDDGAGLSPGWQPGVGLGNLRQRLHHHFGPEAQLTHEPRPEGGCLATIWIPQ